MMAVVTKTAGDKWQAYRDFIDVLVSEVATGQGAIGPDRVRAGIWNRNATEGEMPDQHAINQLLARLPAMDREVIAFMLMGAFRGGVHTALVHLQGHDIAPFENGYEGTPFHDFVGRLDGWEWPERPRE